MADKRKDDEPRDTLTLLITLIPIIIFEVVIWRNIDNMFLKIILSILIPIFSFLILSPIILFVIEKISHVNNCPFLNDKRMLKILFLNPIVYYGNHYFCSVADPVNPSYELYDGLERKISFTNKYEEYCLKKKGIGCPIYEKFCKLNEFEIKQHYFLKLDRSDHDNKNDDKNDKNDKNDHMTFDSVLLFSRELISIHGNEGFLNMIVTKGFQFIEASEALKGCFAEMLRQLNKVELAKALQFCGFSYYCFEHFIWHEDKNISQIYSREQLIEKINKLSHDSLYLKAKIIDPVQIVSPNMNLDILYTASAEPDLMRFISINMISQDMLSVIPDKQKIIDIMMINHIFINLLAGDVTTGSRVLDTVKNEE